MRILAAIPHYYHDTSADDPEPRHGSLGPGRAERVEALSGCVMALHQLYGASACVINLKDRVTRPANALTGGTVDVVVCTTLGRHALADVDLPDDAFAHHPTTAEPVLLGFECQALLRDRLGDYDYYCYLEDDLIARDPWMFLKLSWFTGRLGDGCLLQPNRYEVSRRGPSAKAYIDGDLPRELVAPWQDLDEDPTLLVDILDRRITLHRPPNPHSGCYFLNEVQMRAWAARDDFLDRAAPFVGPLESAATLGIMRNFRVYKAADPDATFLEIEHHGTQFIGKLRRREEGEG